METIEKAKIWCRGEARENPPKKGKKYFRKQNRTVLYEGNTIAIDIA